MKALPFRSPSLDHHVRKRLSFSVPHLGTCSEDFFRHIELESIVIRATGKYSVLRSCVYN